MGVSVLELLMGHVSLTVKGNVLDRTWKLKFLKIRQSLVLNT